ncbi:MAG: crossover junction endodeoxyribonuclease RuvC [Polyangiaceae bacterium]
MLALGIDPGTRKLGWGVVARSGNRLTHVAHGVIKLDGKRPLAERLTVIESQLETVITTHRPDVGSVESLFFHKDAQAAAKLGHARGVVLLILARAGVRVAEYAPAKVKRTVAGGGQADKRQVAMMIRTLFALDELPPLDASDALALAVTHLRLGPIEDRLRDNSLSPALAKSLMTRRRRPTRRKLAPRSMRSP